MVGNLEKEIAKVFTSIIFVDKNVINTLIAHKLFHKNDFVRIIKFFESFLSYCTRDLVLRTSKHFLSFFSAFNSFLYNRPFTYLKNEIWKTHSLNENKTKQS